MKFAQVGYGQDGRADGVKQGNNPRGYTYIVNDNVRTGDSVSPAVKHHISSKIFGTTGKVLATARFTSKRFTKDANGEKHLTGGGMFIQQNLQTRGIEPTRLVTGADAGIVTPLGNTGGVNKRTGAKLAQPFQAGQGELQRRGANMQARKDDTGGEFSGQPLSQDAMTSYQDYINKYGGGV